jgi:hypothetical protein
MAAPCCQFVRGVIVLGAVAQFMDAFCCPTVIHSPIHFRAVYFAAIRRASSLLSSLAAEWRPGSSS